jgi:hypothetical protein
MKVADAVSTQLSDLMLPKFQRATGLILTAVTLALGSGCTTFNKLVSPHDAEERTAKRGDPLNNTDTISESQRNRAVLEIGVPKQ